MVFAINAMIVGKIKIIIKMTKRCHRMVFLYIFAAPKSGVLYKITDY